MSQEANTSISPSVSPSATALVPSRLALQQKDLQPTDNPAIHKDKHGNLFLDIRLIDEGERGRKDYGDLVPLIDSIRDKTLISPISVAMAGTRFRLVAGGRRFRAFVATGSRWIPFVFRDHEDKLDLVEAELEENLHRKNLDWPEEVFLHKKIHETKQALYGTALGRGGDGWGLEKSAEIAGVSKSTMHANIKLAEELERNPGLAARVAKMDKSTAIREMARVKAAAKAVEKVTSGELIVTGEVKNCSAQDLLRSLEPGTVHLILTDPPFGDSTLPSDGTEVKGSGNFGIKTQIRPHDNLTPEASRNLLSETIPLMANALVPGGYLLMFFSFEHYHFLTNALERAGLVVDANPIIWDKTRQVQASSGYTFANSYEPILHAVKPPKSRRMNESQRNILSVSPVPSKNRLHPFQKPLELLHKLINSLTHPGDLVLDPFAGSGAIIKAATDLKRRGVGSEIDPTNWASSQLYLSSAGPELSALGSSKEKR